MTVQALLSMTYLPLIALVCVICNCKWWNDQRGCYQAQLITKSVNILCYSLISKGKQNNNHQWTWHIIHDEIKCDPAATEFDSRIVSGILENIELVVSHIGEIATVKVPSQHGSPFHMKDIWNVLNCAFSLQRKYRKCWMESGYYLVTSTDRYMRQTDRQTDRYRSINTIIWWWLTLHLALKITTTR